MAREADTVHTDPGSIHRLQSLIAELRDNAKVAVHLRDGSTVQGIVVAVPSVQNFVDANAVEGVNAVVKLTDPNRPDWSATIPLDTIERVEHLDSVVYGTSQS